MLKPKERYTSLETSLKLQQAGVHQFLQRGDWYYNSKDKLILLENVRNKIGDYVRAFESSELDEMLPVGTTITKTDEGYEATCRDEKFGTKAESAVEVRGLLYLLIQ